MKNKHINEISEQDDYRAIPLAEFIYNTFSTDEERAEFAREYEVHRLARRKRVLQQYGRQLKRAREEAGLTQQTLADRLQTDIANISRIEHGRHNLTVDYIVKVAQALNRPVRIEIL